MSKVSLVCSKSLLAFFNFVLLGCGCTLITGGLILLLDPEKVLLSRLLASGTLSQLPHPLLYYLALGTSVLGLFLAGIGILGCWASCLRSYCVLSVYFLAVMLILIAECAVYVIASVWPQCLGLGIDSDDLVKALQRNYGAVGQEQFTAAIDLAQANFQCCGIESANEYDTSLWRLQSLSPSLAVPLTCCKLRNFNQTKAYLNPQPFNKTLCQALETNRHEGYRHTIACRDFLENWYGEHYFVFLGAGLIIVLVEFIVLLSTLLLCIKIYKYRKSMRDRQEANMEKSTKRQKGEVRTLENSYQRASPFAYSNDSYVMTNSFRRNYRLTDKA